MVVAADEVIQLLIEFGMVGVGILAIHDRLDHVGDGLIVGISRQSAADFKFASCACDKREFKITTRSM